MPGHVFGANDGSQNSQQRSEKTFSFNRGVFFNVRTRFWSENDGSLNSLLVLRSKKTFLFNRGVFFNVRPRFCGDNDRSQN